jgi:phosphatidylglycerol lysyltransferase
MKARWLLWIILVAFFWLVARHLAEIEQLLAMMTSANRLWILAALVALSGYILASSSVYLSALDNAGVHIPLRDLVPMTLASLFVNVVSPGGFPGGAALFINDARRRGQPATRAAVGMVLQYFAAYAAFSLVLVSGMTILRSMDNLKLYQILTAGFFMALFAIASLLFGVTLWRPHLTRGMLSGLQGAAKRLAARFHRPAFLSDEWVDRNAQDFSEAAAAVRQNPLKLPRTISLALLAFALNMTCLYLVCRAYNQPISLVELLAVFSVSMLFWIVSVTPQGIGVVEGVMALAFTSLGVPSIQATTITLVYRGLAFWFPLLLGFYALRHVKTFGASERSLAESWSVRIIALLTALMGIINVLSAVTPSLADQLETIRRVSPLEVRHGGQLTTALSGFALLLLSVGLWRRKRIAWLLTLATLGISAVSYLVKGMDYQEALLAGGLAIWLLLLRPEFHARSDPPSVKNGLVVLLFSILFTLGYGAAGFYLLNRQYNLQFDLQSSLAQTFVMVTQFYDPGLEPIVGYGRYFAMSIYLVGIATLGYAAIQLIRPVFLHGPAPLHDHARASRIVMSYGRSSTARLALLDDKSYYFSSGGSVIAFVVKGRVGLALGDPIGPPEDAPESILEFSRQCLTNDWLPAFYQALPDNLEHYRSAGFQALQIGQEAIVDLQSFSLSGGENKGLRSAVNRLTRLGYATPLVHPPLPHKLLAELRQVSDEWLSTIRGSEKRFSLGWFDDDYVRSTPVMYVQEPGGRIAAFANILTEYQVNEITVDLLRRRREGENGLVDYLMVNLFGWAREQGYATFNLGLCSFTPSRADVQDPAVDRALRYIYAHISRYHYFKGVQEYTAKFHPAWSPRYLVYPGAANLPRVAYAIANADAGVGGRYLLNKHSL